MDAQYLLKGLLLGLSIAAPVGPIGVLCIRRTLARGQISGLVSGLGAATADAFYGCIAGYGLTVISNLLLSQRVWLNLIGGTYLCYLGVTTFVSKPAQEAASTSGGGLLNSYLSTFLLTLTNPVTILSFVAVFAGLGVVNTDGGYGASGSLVLGVFIGSALWWLVLSGGITLFRPKFNMRSLRWLNRISGLVLLGFGMWSLVGLLGLGSLLS